MDVLATDPGDVYNLSANIFGTGGSSTALPTSWGVAAQVGDAMTGSVSTLASTDGNPAQRGQITPTSDGAWVYTRASSGFAAEDTIIGVVKFETDAAGWTGTSRTLLLE